jgi:autotransporter-associated beta strand protein/T5SS/PEP-CTERM-associated repeat protein
MAGSAGTLTMTGGLLELSSMGWLEDTSTFVGNFAFNGGTLKTTDSSESITLGSAAVLAGALSNPNSAQARTLDLGGDLAYSGVLAGTGAFTKAGPGDLTLSAAGTVARFHVIDGGRIVSGIDNALNFNSTLTVNESGIFDMAGFDQTLYGVNGTGQILIKSGSLVVGASNGSSLFSGSFSGSGALTKVGNGNFTLTGNSTFTGTTAVTGGSLTIDADSALGTAPAGMTAGHLVLQNSTLITTNSFSLNSNRGISLEGAGGTISPQAGTTLTYGGITDGSGVLVKRGGGTLRLTGNNSHTGGTLIFDGTLLGDTNSLQGSIVNNATLVFDQSSTGVYSAELSGSGSLTKSGAGNLTLTGTNSYSGGTTVAEGTLTGDASSLQGAIVNNTSVVFEQAGVGTYGGGLSGPGSLSKSGPGELILSGANSHTGGTFVSAGTLTVASATNLGNTSGAVSVAAGATLATGNSFASNHSITVNGGSLSNSGDLLVGASAAGSLSLVSGSTASAQNFNVAFNGGSSGDVEIRSGSAVTVGNATTVGWHPSSQGNVLITGANSILSNTGVYYLGWQGDGSTTIADGGELMSTGVRIADAPGSSGILNINTDGTLETAGLSAGSGSATVNFAGGTLRATGSFSSHVPLILSNTSTFDSNGEAVTLSNQISGDGALNKLGSGALTLSGDNTYTGGTTVSDGSVLGDASSLQGDIVNNALLTFEQSAEGTYGNVVSGSGALAKQGEGSLTLTNANLYTGGTTVHTGTLRLGAGGASGSVPGDIINHATLAFHRSDDYTFPGVISGSGAVIHDGSVLRFSAAQSYEGPTQINTGVLVLPFQIDQGLSSLTEVAIGAGAILDISNSSLTVAGLSGGGSVYSFRDSNPSAGHLTINTPTGPSQVFSGVLGSTFPDFAISKTGQGTLTLTGANTYTGATTVNQGRLEFANGLTTAGAGILVTQNGTLAAGQTIARNLQNDANVVAMGESPLSLTGELTGTGQFSGDFLFAGTTRPGNSPGLMTIDGDLEFAANHVFEAEISGFTRGSGYDAVDISGSLHLDGTLRLVLADGLSLTKGNLFNLFAASSYTGEITTLDVSEATLPENLRWDASELNTTGTLKVRGRNFAEWAADFSVAANPNADPLGEGVPLLLKYALGLDPTIRATPGELPDFAHWTDGGQDHLAVSFDPDQGVEGVSIIAEISGDLVNWSEDDVVSVENFTGEELFRDVHPIGEHERRFIRLRFTLEETP